MQLKKVTLIAFVPLALTLTGCMINVEQQPSEDRSVENRSTISSLSLDLTQTEVTERLGIPDFTELHQSEKGNVKVLFYRTHRNKADGITTKDECTPLIFVNSRLVGWGEAAHNQIM